MRTSDVSGPTGATERQVVAWAKLLVLVLSETGWCDWERIGLHLAKVYGVPYPEGTEKALRYAVEQGWVDGITFHDPQDFPQKNAVKWEWLR